MAYVWETLIERNASIFLPVLKIIPSGFLNTLLYRNTVVLPKPNGNTSTKLDKQSENDQRNSPNLVFYSSEGLDCIENLLFSAALKKTNIKH